jgi:predicted amidohydrolase
MPYKIASVQAEDVQGDISTAIAVIKTTMETADHDAVNMVCFPECFLQGYTLDDKETKDRALELDSPLFLALIASLSSYKVTAIFGVIEKERDDCFNTAVVVRKGKLVGKYRKNNLFETNFKPGIECPVFADRNLTFGVNICYDARFSEGAVELSRQGAKVIFYPLNNRLPKEKALKYREKHLSNLIDRAKETQSWVVSSDIVARDETHTGYGCTAVVNPFGEVVSQAKEFESGMLVFALP